MNSDDDGVLFLLEGPVIDPHSIEQFKNVCLVSLFQCFSVNFNAV